MIDSEKPTRKSILIKKLQFTTSIRLPPENIIKAVGVKFLKERGYPANLGECIQNILERLRDMDGLRYCSGESSKLECFRLEDDPESMIQISSKGKIIMTVGSPNSYRRLHRMLLEAIMLNGYSTDILNPIEATVYKVEKYEVRSLRDVESLLIHQMICGSKHEGDE